MGIPTIKDQRIDLDSRKDGNDHGTCLKSRYTANITNVIVKKC